MERTAVAPWRGAVALALLLVASRAAAVLHTDLFNTTIDDPDITIRTELPGVERAVTEEDLEPILRNNLEPDLLPWRRLGRPLRVMDLLDFMHQINTEWLEYRRNFLAIVRIKNNKMTWWAYPDARGWCTRRVKIIADEFHRFIKTAKMRFPDVVYVMNGYDKPLCERGNCSAPLFTFDKRWNASAAALGLPASAHDDILHPVMNHPFEALVDYPWDKKIEKGFMRVGVYAAMPFNCSRVLVNKVGLTKAGSEVLDVGIYQNRHWKVKVKTVPPVPMELHARWKYLLNTDGQAASWRLAKLLAINSAIVKQRSDAIEYYYRSLKEGEHYVSFDHTDVVQVIKGLKGRDRELQAMAKRNQAFAYRYLSQHSRTLYAAVSLRRYAELFDGAMEPFVASVPENFTLAWFLALREKLRAAEGKGRGGEDVGGRALVEGAAAGGKGGVGAAQAGRGKAAEAAGIKPKPKGKVKR
ncbi:hypothetical protein HYH03_018226 [Edaphochlamys debaryana]|uniref:Glycosyl transferase CAP10 domain-containing protein n=1 Tax=Edaphochlamys debaryana TaxID=47281 RepID=A0A835XF15_9CHLO|nr:hypothetical protein HYH03_018226 [Edaphochlamys debaryana]|eukprot:KAG2482883.1 hypothetical protein HYH03_018226 [Edaphochlamys debaryana]